MSKVKGNVYEIQNEMFSNFYDRMWLDRVCAKY